VKVAIKGVMEIKLELQLGPNKNSYSLVNGVVGEFIFSQVANEFADFHGNQRFISAFSRHGHWLLSSASPSLVYPRVTK
jgi:hypothetical protein